MYVCPFLYAKGIAIFPFEGNEKSLVKFIYKKKKKKRLLVLSKVGFLDTNY